MARRARYSRQADAQPVEPDAEGNVQVARLGAQRGQQYDQEEGIAVQYMGGGARSIKSRVVPRLTYYFTKDGLHDVVDVHPAEVDRFQNNRQFRVLGPSSKIKQGEVPQEDEQEPEATTEEDEE